MKKNIYDGQVSILIEIDGEVHLVGMNKERLEVLSSIIKNSVEVIVPTNRSQKELREFLNYKKATLV